MTNAYASLSMADSWFMERAILTWLEADEEVREAALLRASEWIDTMFVFAGRPEDTTQPRAFPRIDLFLPDGRAVTGVPDAVLEAVYTLALALLEDDETAEAALGISPQLQHQKAGGIELRFATGDHTKLTRIERLIHPFRRQPHDHLLRRG
ncbi:DnaT-like ssDNA-binding protein [Alphaproteobacteria bacterium LSUCC0684]